MQVRLQDWSRTITLVPWYEATRDREHELGSVGALELRRLISADLGAAMALRRLIHALDSPHGVSALDEHELVGRVVRLIETGMLRVEVATAIPRPSDPIVRYEPIEHEPPEQLEDELLLFWVDSEADDWPEMDVDSEAEPWPDMETRARNDELDFGTNSEPETLEFDTGAS